MEIIINKIDTILVKEDYSEYEKDDVISVISDVCKYVDEFCIADFVAIFAFWDKRFSDLDFLYDFTSIVDELSSLQLFLESKVGSFLLHFYERDRRVVLTFDNENLEFQILASIGSEVFFHGELDPIDFNRSIQKIIKDFHNVLSIYFPKALKIFKEEEYLFYK